jgi:glycine cleavage system H lipoate-binding protein
MPEGGRWKLTQGDAIVGIESGKWAFWVETGGKVVDVIVAVSATGHKYLKTRNDGEQPTNLLILPECP